MSNALVLSPTPLPCAAKIGGGKNCPRSELARLGFKDNDEVIQKLKMGDFTDELEQAIHAGQVVIGAMLPLTHTLTLTLALTLILTPTQALILTYRQHRWRQQLHARDAQALEAQQGRAARDGASGRRHAGRAGLRARGPASLRCAAEASSNPNSNTN